MTDLRDGQFRQTTCDALSVQSVTEIGSGISQRSIKIEKYGFNHAAFVK
jgi:hypothetical protein